VNTILPKYLLLALTLWLLPIGSHARAEGFAVVVSLEFEGEVNLEKLGHLFLGRNLETANGDLLTPVYHTGNKVLHREFTRQILKRSTSQLRSYLAKQVFTGKAKPPLSVSSNSKMKSLLMENQGYIGYLPLSENLDELKVLFVFNG